MKADGYYSRPKTLEELGWSSGWIWVTQVVALATGFVVGLIVASRGVWGAISSDRRDSRDLCSIRCCGEDARLMFTWEILVGNHLDKGGGRFRVYGPHRGAWYCTVGVFRTFGAVMIMLGVVAVRVEWTA